LSFSLVRFVGALGGALVLAGVLLVGASVTLLNVTTSAPRGWYIVFPVHPNPLQELGDRAALVLHPSWKAQLSQVAEAPLIDATMNNQWYAIGCPTQRALRYAAAIAYTYLRERGPGNLCARGFAPLVKPVAIQTGSLAIEGGKAWWGAHPLPWTRVLRSRRFRAALVRFSPDWFARRRIYHVTSTTFFLFSPVRGSFDSRYYGPVIRLGYARRLFS